MSLLHSPSRIFLSVSTLTRVVFNKGGLAPDAHLLAWVWDLVPAAGMKHPGEWFPAPQCGYDCEVVICGFAGQRFARGSLLRTRSGQACRLTLLQRQGGRQECGAGSVLTGGRHQPTWNSWAPPPVLPALSVIAVEPGAAGGFDQAWQAIVCFSSLTGAGGESWRQETLSCPLETWVVLFHIHHSCTL